jgi:hypothetical protein
VPIKLIRKAEVNNNQSSNSFFVKRFTCLTE